MDSGPIPAHCISLTEAYKRKPGQPYEVMGVCVDFQEPAKSRGTDYTMTITLHDQTWAYANVGSGMTFRFFHKDVQNLPPVPEQGDVVILRNIKTMKVCGATVGVSNFNSKWVVLPSAALRSLDSLKDFYSQARWPGKGDISQCSRVDPFTEDEMRYAKWLEQKADASQWRPIVRSTSLQHESETASNVGSLSSHKGKFRLIKDLEPPSMYKTSFADLLGEVRKIYGGDIKAQLELTDYTTNDHLYNYRYGDDEDGRDGDPFKYINEAPTPWPGPWGKMTMSITVYDAHSTYARSNVKEGMFVYLRNVQIKMDNNGSRLEGAIRGDRSHPERVNVEVRKPHEGQSDELMKALLMRKRDYEAQAKAENLRFIRNAQPPQKRQKDAPDEHKSKKAKTRNRKKKENRAKAGPEERPEGPVAATEKPVSKLNGNVRCENVNVPCKTIEDILDHDILVRTTPKGTTFSLPFQNCKYKASVRVVDFFPDDIADFAVPRWDSQYDFLSDNGDEEESDIDLTQVHGDEVKWEWRFFLLVEDARKQVRGGERPARMELLVADTDGDYLLNMDACNLRDKNNACELARVREKLFHLWGDLQETKKENTTLEESSVNPSARPFQCMIKEYGVPVRSLGAGSKESSLYERRFRLFGTTI